MLVIVLSAIFLRAPMLSKETPNSKRVLMGDKCEVLLDSSSCKTLQEPARWVRTFAAKADNLSSVSIALTVKGEDQLLQVVF